MQEVRGSIPLISTKTPNRNGSEFFCCLFQNLVNPADRLLSRQDPPVGSFATGSVLRRTKPDDKEGRSDALQGDYSHRTICCRDFAFFRRGHPPKKADVPTVQCQKTGSTNARATDSRPVLAVRPTAADRHTPLWIRQGCTPVL